MINTTRIQLQIRSLFESKGGDEEGREEVEDREEGEDRGEGERKEG